MKRPKATKEKHYSRQRRAEILLEGVNGDDSKLCAKYSITARTLQRWRKSLREGNDRELSENVAEKQAALTARWADQVPCALTACLGFIERAAKEASPKDPEAIHAIAGAMKMVAETDGTYKYIDGMLNVQLHRTNGQNGQAPGQVRPANVTPIRRDAAG